MMRAQMSDRFVYAKWLWLILDNLDMLFHLSETHQCHIQAAVYGLGVCAEHGGSAFKSLVGGIVWCWIPFLFFFFFWSSMRGWQV